MSLRILLRRAHGPAGISATLLIALFALATLIAELSGDAAAVVAVKRAILIGLVVLIPTLALAGGSGAAVAGPSPKGVAARKLARMKIVAPVGLLVLTPATILLAGRAETGRFDALFYAVQALELAAGGFNLSLLVANLLDGLRLAGRLPRNDGPKRRTRDS